uniref:Si:ch211-255f4.7 n=1 Tax=Labrus bergylta TaxID=56723 RepID=A0A3Q3G5T7_9LABR
MLNAIVGDNSDVEDMSDEDDDPGVEQLSSEDPIPPYSPESDQQSCDDSNAESQLHLHASKRHSDGDRECWDSAPFIPDLVQFEAADKRLHEREDWQPLDYVEQYIDTELITRIAKCTNAMSAGHSGGSLHSDTNEIFHFFGASILLSCVPYPEVRIFWSSALRISAICDKFPLERFLELSQHLKVVVDDYIFSDQRREDKFWKIRPFMDRILKGCWRQVRPEYVLITEQIIPFKGACPFRQHVPLKPQALGMRTFVLASPDGIVLDFEVYQGANAHRSSQAQDTEGLGLAALVIKRLAKDLQPGTKLYCDCFFTTVKAVDQMLKKKVYLTGPVMESRVNKALKKLPSNLHMKQDRRCASAVATRSDGKVCVVKWYDNKPNLMLSAAHAEQPGDTIQQWSRKDKQYLTVTRPSIVREYQSKMSGVELLNKVMANYPMTLRTQKWTIQILMHLTDLALANSWLLYCADHTEQGTQREDLMQYIDFRVAVALAFLAKGETPQVTPVPHVSAGTTSVTHLPEMVTLKNAAWCRATGCTEKSCVRCVTCDAFLCLKPERNCYAVFHTGRQV